MTVDEFVERLKEANRKAMSKRPPPSRMAREIRAAQSARFWGLDLTDHEEVEWRFSMLMRKEIIWC